MLADLCECGLCVLRCRQVWTSRFASVPAVTVKACSTTVQTSGSCSPLPVTWVTPLRPCVLGVLVYVSVRRLQARTSTLPSQGNWSRLCAAIPLIMLLRGILEKAHFQTRWGLAGRGRSGTEKGWLGGTANHRVGRTSDNSFRFLLETRHSRIVSSSSPAGHAESLAVDARSRGALGIRQQWEVRHAASTHPKQALPSPGSESLA